MGKTEKVRYAVHQVVFMAFKPSVCIDNLPDKLYYADSLLFGLVPVDEFGETPQVYAVLSLGLGCFDE